MCGGTVFREQVNTISESFDGVHSYRLLFGEYGKCGACSRAGPVFL